MKYSGHRKLLCELSKLSKLNARILDEHWCIYSCLQIPPRENWFQYIRRVYTTAINFPCISTLPRTICCIKYVFKLTILINIFHLPTPYYAGDRDFTKNKHKLTSHSQDRNSLIKRTASSCFHPRLSSSIRKGFPLVNLSSGSDGFNNRIYFRGRHINQC